MNGTDYRPARAQKPIRLTPRIALLCIGIFCLLSGKSEAFDTFTAHGGPVKDFTLSNDGSILASASYDYSIVLWDSETLSPLGRLIGHDAAVVAVAFSPDGRYLVSGGDDYSALVWDVSDVGRALPENPVARLSHDGKITGVTISHDGKLIATSSWDGSVYVWSLTDFSLQSKLSGHKGPVNDVQFSKDRPVLYSAGTDGQIKNWNIANFTYESTLVRNGWGINVFYVDEMKGLLAYGMANGDAAILDLASTEKTFTLEENNAPVLALDFDADSNLLAFGNGRGRVVLVDVSSGDAVVDVKAASGPVWALKILPQKGSVITGGLDDAITEFNLGDPPWNFAMLIEKSRRFSTKSTEISNGEKQFLRKCSICHTLDKEGQFRAGPSLYGVFGRTAGTLKEYPYSEALLSSSLIWTEETISELFTKGPHIVTPGTKMPLQRIKNDKDRIDLIDYLKSATGPQQ